MTTKGYILVWDGCFLAKGGSAGGRVEKGTYREMEMKEEDGA